MKQLADEQKRFFDEYLIGLDVVEASKKTGYVLDNSIPESGYYTYFLIDPRTSDIFYVGKGKGKRLADHAKLAARGNVDNAKKFERITSIMADKKKVIEVVFSTHQSESDAFSVEKAAIRLLRDHGLTNISGGVVTNEDKAKIQAQYFLDNMWSFEQWMAVALPRQIEAAKKHFGCCRNAYEAIRRELQEIIDLKPAV